MLSDSIAIIITRPSYAFPSQINVYLPLGELRYPWQPDTYDKTIFSDVLAL